MPNAEELIHTARELCEKATPGPWIRNRHIVTEKNGKTIVCRPPNTGNADFIASSRTLLPALADALEEVIRENERLKQANRIAEKAWDDSALCAAEAQIEQLTARAESAEKERNEARKEVCKACHAFSDATGHGWDENCEVCKMRQPAEGSEKDENG